MTPLGNGLAIIGGKSQINDWITLDNTHILLFTCSNLICKVKELQQLMPINYHHFVAIQIPNIISGCVSKGKYQVID